MSNSFIFFLLGVVLTIVVVLFTAEILHIEPRKKPLGELIFTQINDDEAKVAVKIHEDSWLDVMAKDEVTLKVIRE